MAKVKGKIPDWSTKDGRIALIHDDCMEVTKGLEDSSVDVIFSDSPYFLSGKGSTCSGGTWAKVDKGKWDRPPETFSEMHALHLRWLGEFLRVLKPTGTMWLCSTHHNGPSLAVATRQLGGNIINQVVWHKPAPPPCLGRRSLTFSHETLYWIRKTPTSRHYFDYAACKSLTGKQLKDIWTIGRPTKCETVHGKHPTQKPAALIHRALVASLPKGGLVFDPFSGSGTVAAVAAASGQGWRCIAAETDSEFVELAKRRVVGELPQRELADTDQAPAKRKRK